jgi:CHAD domain-containing protein
MGRDATLEREIKMDAPIALALPDLRHLVGGTVRLPEERLVTRYFDTRDRRLWRQGMTLRHRMTDDAGDGVWTLKLPHASAGQALERTEVTWAGPSHEFPSDARELLRGIVRREPLGQLTMLETTRQRLVLCDDSDHELAELDDDVVLVSGGPRQGTTFRQVELEFRDEKWKGRQVIDQLEKAGARVEKDTKLGKAIALPSRSTGPPVDEQSTVADLVRASLRAGLDRLLAHDWQLRLTVPDPAVDNVHQARVATRRLRSDLKTFGVVLDPLWRDHLRSELKWLGRVLGELRDRDVLSDGFSHAPVAVRQRLAVQRVDAGRRLAEVLSSERYVNLVDRLHAGSDRLPLAPGTEHEAQKPAAEIVPSLVAAQWRAVRHQVRRAGRHPSATQLHQIRIKSKQLRYAAEAATPVIGKPARRTAVAAEHVQTVLGEHHDAVAAEAWLRDEWAEAEGGHSATVSPAVTFEAGRLVAEANHRQQESREQWTDAWAKLRKPKRLRWLSHQAK